MNKAELIEQLAESHGLTKVLAKAVVEDLLSTIVTKVKKGEDVALLGFGTFKQHARPARKGFNPASGVAIKIAAQKVPKFVPGAAFKAAVNPKAAKKAKKG